MSARKYSWPIQVYDLSAVVLAVVPRPTVGTAVTFVNMRFVSLRPEFAVSTVAPEERAAAIASLFSENRAAFPTASKTSAMAIDPRKQNAPISMRWVLES